MAFRLTDVDDSTVWTISVTYASPTSAVQVSKSNEFIRSEVHLVRLVDGQLPPYPIWVTEARIDWTLLDNVLEARAPGLLERSLQLTGLNTADLFEQLGFWAESLRAVAPEFLDGDLSCIDEAAVLVRKRVEAQPQTMTVWLPEDATDADLERAMESARTTVPPEVRITGQRYRRGRVKRPFA